MNRVKVQSGRDTGGRVRKFHLIIPPNLRNLLKESSNLREAPLVMISFARRSGTFPFQIDRRAAGSAIKVRYLVSSGWIIL